MSYFDRFKLIIYYKYCFILFAKYIIDLFSLNLLNIPFCNSYNYLIPNLEKLD